MELQSDNSNPTLVTNFIFTEYVIENEIILI